MRQAAEDPAIGGSPRRRVPVALLAGIALAAVLVAFYVRVILPFVLFPADLIMWGETDFTGNVIRLRGGLPMYTSVADVNSSTYPPTAAALTYWIVTALRLPVEVPVLRAVQMVYVAAAALLALGCWRMLRSLVPATRPVPNPVAWSLLVLLTTYIAATSPDTSQWVHALHTDALSMLWSMVSFAALLAYVRSPGPWALAALCAVPAVGFHIKQYLLVWAPVSFLTLLIDDPRNLRRLVALAAGTGALTVGGVGLLRSLWGPDYVFWVYEVVGGARSRIGFSAAGFEMSVPRAADHLLRAWAPLAPGFVGGWLLIRRRPGRRVAALWVPWTGLLATEALTSGTGWSALYHFGPGVVVGVVWLLVALPESWPEYEERPLRVVGSAFGLAGLVALYLALGAVPSGDAARQRYWKRSAPAGSEEYARSIATEFEGVDPAAVLMDWGNWAYLPSNHLARDRAISMADFATVGRYDLLEPLLDRIRRRTYSKILLHRYDSPDYFIYDWGALERPTGVREALRQNYQVVRVIPGLEVQGAPHMQYVGPVSVLVPRQ